MNTSAPYSELVISETRIVRFFDHSSIYFGDYYHVRLEARCEFELPACQKARSCDYSGAGLLPTPVYTRMLERMAVPSASVEEAKGALIEEFAKNAVPYLSSPDFPLKMISRDITAKSSPNRKYAES